MNINENIRNKRKLVEKLRWYTYKITCMSTTIASSPAKVSSYLPLNKPFASRPSKFIISAD